MSASLIRIPLVSSNVSPSITRVHVPMRSMNTVLTELDDDELEPKEAVSCSDMRASRICVYAVNVSI